VRYRVAVPPSVMVMEVMLASACRLRATLVFPRDHCLFGVEHAPSPREIGRFAVANRKKEKPLIVIPTETEIGDIPT
jgi:hypothetical protein